MRLQNLDPAVCKTLVDDLADAAQFGIALALADHLVPVLVGQQLVMLDILHSTFAQRLGALQQLHEVLHVDFQADSLASHDVLDSSVQQGAVGAEQAGVGQGGVHDIAGTGDALDGLVAGDLHVAFEDGGGDVSDSLTVAEALGQVADIRLHHLHRVDSATPAVDRLAGVTHHDNLHPALLVHDDVEDARGRVLELIHIQHLDAAEDRLAQLEELQVGVVGGEDDARLVGAFFPQTTRQLGHSFHDERDVLGVVVQLLLQFHRGDVLRLDALVSRLLEASHGVTHQQTDVRCSDDHAVAVLEGLDVVVAGDFSASASDVDVAATGANQLVLQTLAEGGVGAAVGGLALDVRGELLRSLVRSHLVEGEVQRRSGLRIRHHGQGRGLARASAGFDLQHHHAADQGVDAGLLLLGGLAAHVFSEVSALR